MQEMNQEENSLYITSVGMLKDIRCRYAHLSYNNNNNLHLMS